MKNAWMTYDETKIKEVMNLSDDYMAFLSKGKTERKCVSLILEEAKKHGYKDINEIIKNKESLKPQDKVYMNMMNKSVALMHIGNRPIEEGMNILTHRGWILNKILYMKMEKLHILIRTIMVV